MPIDTPKIQHGRLINYTEQVYTSTIEAIKNK